MFFFLILALAAICSVEWNNFSNFDRGSPKEHFCETILKSVHWSRRCHLSFFLFLAVAAICSVEWSDFSNFGRGSPKKHFCEIILILVH